MHSDDATPHLSVWQAGMGGMIPTDLSPESSDDEPLDPTLDQSGVPYPVEDVEQVEEAKEEPIPSSTASPGKEDVKEDVETKASQEDSNRTQEEIMLMVDRANLHLANAEMEKAALKRKHDTALGQQLQSLFKKDEELAEHKKQINELKRIVEQLRASIADLQNEVQRPVVQATVVENASSSSHLDQSMESSWLLTTAPPLVPENPTPVHEVVEEAKAVDGVLLNSQQASVLLLGKVFEGAKETNIHEWSPVDTSPGSPKEVEETPPAEEVLTALGSPSTEEAVVAPVSPPWRMAPASPPDYGQVAESSPCTPPRTPPKSPRSTSSRAKAVLNAVFRRSPSQKRT